MVGNARLQKMVRNFFSAKNVLQNPDARIVLSCLIGSFDFGIVTVNEAVCSSRQPVISSIKSQCDMISTLSTLCFSLRTLSRKHLTRADNSSSLSRMKDSPTIKSDVSFSFPRCSRTISQTSLRS